MQIISKKEAMTKVAECSADLLDALYVADLNRMIGNKGIVSTSTRFVAMHKVVDCKVEDLLVTDDNRLVFFWDTELADDIMANRLVKED